MLTFPAKISKTTLSYKEKKKKKGKSKLNIIIENSDSNQAIVEKTLTKRQLETIDEQSEIALNTNYEFLDSVII
jgi:hypothetical protein